MIPHTPMIGIDLGGTKTAIVVLSVTGEELFSKRLPTPKGDYDATLQVIKSLIEEAEQKIGQSMSIGVGMPGSISPKTGLVQNANSTWLNGKPFHRDLATLTGKKIRTANDANCLALSEALDGVAKGAKSVFGVILGTGCGGGLVHDGKLIEGHRHIGGEWGHTPLPWMTAQEFPGTPCWCGQNGCMESWISGPGLAAHHKKQSGQNISAETLYQKALAGENDCQTSLNAHCSRLARGLALIVNIFDPEVIVLGGGLSKMKHLYQDLPSLMSPYIFSDDKSIDIRPPQYGDASGVRGAARLWQNDTAFQKQKP